MISAQGYEPFGSLLPGRNYSSSSYNYGFQGQIKDDEIHGATGTSYDFGARLYDPRIGRWLSLDPFAGKYPELSAYAFVGNMPISAIDPNGKDIVVLNDLQGANGAGHQAVLIGDDKRGWTYISKDGASKGAYGKPKFVVMHFSSIQEFVNSPHNHQLNDHAYHSVEGGGESTTFDYKLDDKGNKIQRYDRATRFYTDPAYDQASIDAATGVAREDYCLGISDCSDVPLAAMKEGRDTNGSEFKVPSANWGWVLGLAGKIMAETPNFKQAMLEYLNGGAMIDRALVPEDLKKSVPAPAPSDNQR